MKISIVLLFVMIVHLAFPEKGQAQPEVKNVLSFGYEVFDISGNGTGSFSKQRGFIVGFLTGIRLDHDSSSAYLLGIELNYVQMFAFRTNVAREYVHMGTYHDTYDEKHDLHFLELGLSIERRISLNEDMMIGPYLGGGIGIGVNNFKTHELSHERITSPAGYHAPESPYEKDTGFIVPISINLGLRYFYKRLMLDLRYKNIPLSNSDNENISQANLFLQIGIILF